MYVVDVIPFSPSAPPGTLSYRSARTYAPGDIVRVLLRRRKVPAVVIAVEDARANKASLKAASFTLSGTISEPFGSLPEPVLKAVAQTAVWHAASPGSVLYQLLAPWISDEAPPLAAKGDGFVLETIEQPLSERRARYRALIDAAQGRGMATLLAVSTLAEVEYWKKAFADLEPLVLSGALPERKRAEALGKARASRTLVIATPHFAFAQMEHLGLVLIERIGAGGFRLLKRPYLDLRIALLELARACSLELVQGDYPLPLENRSGARKSPAKGPAVEILDVRAEREEGEAWSAIPPTLIARIRGELETGGRVAAIAVRKGYAPSVVCRDCGQSLKDERGYAYSFFTENGTRLFRTADGKSTKATDIACPNCGSWNLLPLGVGVERVAEALRSAFPDAPVILFEADTARTAVGARRRLAELAAPGAIVVGTEAMVPWLLAASPAPLSLAAIISADSLLALPFWRARERFMRLALLLPSLAPRSLVATRLPDDAAVRTLKDPKDQAYFDEESMLRRALGYPPFGTLISLSWQGGSGPLDSLEETVRNALAPTELRTVPDRSVRGQVRQRTRVLLLPKDAWPDETLSAKLAALPPSVRVLVDPESFW